MIEVQNQFTSKREDSSHALQATKAAAKDKTNSDFYD